MNASPSFARAFACLLAAAALMLAAGPASAQGPSKIGGSGDWAAYTLPDDGGTVCYMASVPKKAEGKYTKRDDAFALVTNRPSAKTSGVVSIVAGYTYKAGEAVTVQIDRESYRLFTDGDRAWTPGPEVDGKLVAAMRKGRTMVVKGRSSRGTLTTDTYSLIGFTATKAVIDKACAK
jgi:hypothetical protein